MDDDLGGEAEARSVLFQIRRRARQEAVFGYEALGPLARAQVRSLSDILTHDPSWDVRRAAALALGGIGPEARSAAPALFRAARDESAWVRNSAFIALEEILPDARLTLPVLASGLDDPFELARFNAAAALGRYGPAAEAAVLALLRVLAT